MSNCHHCKRPAFVAISGCPLCLQCYSDYNVMQFRNFLINSVMLNNANDDLEAIAPYLGNRNRIPVAELANVMANKNIYNNINVSNSTIGGISTGNLARINSTIEVSKGNEREEFGSRLKCISEAVCADPDLTPQQKDELIGILRAIAEESQQRLPNGTVMKSLFDGLIASVAKFAMIADAAEKLYSAWQKFIGS